MFEFLMKGFYSDHLIIFNKKEFKVHLEVLKEKSKFFREIYEKKEKVTNIILLDLDNKEICPSLFESLIKDLYVNVGSSLISFLLEENSLNFYIDYLYLLNFFKINSKFLIEKIKLKISFLLKKFSKKIICILPDSDYSDGFNYPYYYNQEFSVYGSSKITKLKYEGECSFNEKRKFSLYLFKENKWELVGHPDLIFKTIKIIEIYKEYISYEKYVYLQNYTYVSPNLVDFKFEDLLKVKKHLQKSACEYFLNKEDKNKEDLQRFYNYCLKIDGDIDLSLL